MPAFSNPKLRIFDQDLNDAGAGELTNIVMSAKGRAMLNRVGHGECTVKVQSGLATIAKGNIAVCYVYDYIAAANVMVNCFTIEEIHQKTTRDGMSEIRFSGRDLLGELSGMRHFVDIGAGYLATTLSGKSADPNSAQKWNLDSVGTLYTTVRTGESGFMGTYEVHVVDSTGFSIGDDILIGLDPDGYDVDNDGYYTVVTSIDGDDIYVRDPLPKQTHAGCRVVKPEIFPGDSVIILQGDPTPDGTLHYSRISDENYKVGPQKIDIVAGVSVDTASGANMTVVSSHIDTTQDGSIKLRTGSADILDIMQPAVDYFGWTTDLTAAGTVGYGTTDGTAHKVDGPSTIQMLIKCNELTSEWFRIERTDADGPERVLAWRASSDASGITLQMPTQANIEAAAVDTSKGIIKSLTAETRWKIATAIVPKGATDDFDIDDRNKTTYPDSDPAGFTTSLWYGVWLITNDDAALADYIYVHYVTFSDIEPISDSDENKQTAANELYLRARTYLQDNDAAEEFKQIRTVLHADVLPGQTITTDYSEANWTDSETVYIVEVAHSIGRSGIRETTLITSNDNPYNRETASSLLVSGATFGGSLTSSGGGGGGGGGGVTDHGNLSGLLDDDHTQYLLVDGSRGLAGNLDVAASVTIDGVDISAHAAAANAHHDPVTAGTDISLSVQQVSVDATQNAYTNPGQTLKSDANGNLRLAGLTLGNTAIDTGMLQLHSDVDAYAHNYAPPGASAFTTGWKIDSGDGSLQCAYLKADQLHVQLFQADITMAKANGLIVTDSVAVLSADFVVPAVSSNDWLYVDDNPALGTAAVFDVAGGDYVRLRAFKRDSGLSVFDVYGTVNTYQDQGDGTQRWNFITRYAGPADAAVGLTIQAGAPVIGYGASGQGWWEVDAGHPDGDGGPYTQIGTWTTNPYTAANRTLHTRYGNLNGVLGLVADEWGIAVGTDLSDTTEPYAILSDTQMSLYDVDLTIRDSSGDPAITLDDVDGIVIYIQAVGASTGFDTISWDDGSISPVAKLGFWQPGATQWSGLLSMTDYADGDQTLTIETDAPSGRDSTINIIAHTNADATQGTVAVSLVNDVGTGDRYFGAQADNIFLDGGVYVGSSGNWTSNSVGQVFLDQGAGDYNIMRFISSDVAHNVTTIVPTDVYGYANKVAATTGGLAWGGVGEDEIGILIAGISTNADTTEATTSDGSVELAGYIKSGTGVTAHGADDNVVVMKTNTTARWILKGDGEVYSDYSTAMTAFPDTEDDMALISTVADTLSGDIIHGEWDDFVTYNRDDLARLDIVTKDGFVNNHNMTKLFIGAMRQLNSRIAELEKRLA